MELIPVFRFTFIDRASGAELPSSDYATLEAIKEMGAHPIMESMLRVGAERISTAGLLKRSGGPGKT